MITSSLSLTQQVEKERHSDDYAKNYERETELDSSNSKTTETKPTESELTLLCYILYSSSELGTNNIQVKDILVNGSVY